MKNFVFEKDLPHQTQPVQGVLSALEGITAAQTAASQNPAFQFDKKLLKRNLQTLKDTGEFKQAYEINVDSKPLVFDISMETGTGKTYAYAKTIFELNKRFRLAKFIIAVPRLAIKAGTVAFLNSEAARDHFHDKYERFIHVHELQSKSQSGKHKKQSIPQAITEFCSANIDLDKTKIHVLVVNAGMINSPTMRNTYDRLLFDTHATPFAGIAETKPFLIIDEPHMMKRGQKTYNEILKFEPQLILRYGATFDGDIVNLVNELTSVDAFNNDLVKGIKAHIATFNEAKGIALKLTALSGSETTFELNDNGKKTTHKIANGQSLATLHNAISDLYASKMNKSKLVLSNGVELSKGDTINPYSYHTTLQKQMMQNAIKTHFKTERELILASPKIKPITLFFIDNIDSYRQQDGHLRKKFEQMVEAEIQQLAKNETNSDYKAYLRKALTDIPALHGGYFSEDNSGKEEKIQKEIAEILHDKQSLLSFDNPRRFIFSKWTLREGWDNPNVFTICKLRSSGSETSKLQEVGRGLRLPVNEYMARDKSKTYFLNYFVDFTENDFVDKLVSEINKNSTIYNETKLDEAMIGRLLAKYPQFAEAR